MVLTVCKSQVVLVQNDSPSFNSGGSRMYTMSGVRRMVTMHGTQDAANEGQAHIACRVTGCQLTQETRF